MTITKTAIHGLEKQDKKDMDWHIPLNKSLDLIDGKLPPLGGDAGQMLVKKSNTDSDFEFKSAATVEKPPGGMVVGNILGGLMSFVSKSEIKISPIFCYDSENEIVLKTTVDQTISISTTPSQINSVFICDDGVFRTDPDVLGSALTPRKIRWIGFVYVNYLGELVDFNHVDNHIMFYFAHIEIGIFSTTVAHVNMGLFLPEGRVKSLDVAIYKTHTEARVQIGADGKFTAGVNIKDNGWAQASGIIPLKTISAVCDAGDARIYVSSVFMLR